MSELIIGFAAICVLFVATYFIAGLGTRTTRKTSESGPQPLLGVVMPQKKDDNNE